MLQCHLVCLVCQSRCSNILCSSTCLFLLIATIPGSTRHTLLSAPSPGLKQANQLLTFPLLLFIIPNTVYVILPSTLICHYQMAFSSKQVLRDTLDWTLVEKGKALRACLEQAKAEKRKRLNWGGREEVAAERQRCPRCNSTDTKFCYYNNYNKSQPRHLCRACKRHWTVGGTLRDVPVGGARKSKRSRPAKTASNNTTEPPPTSTPFPPLFFAEINHGADDDHLYDDALDVSDETFPFGLGLADVGCSCSTSTEHRHELAIAGSDRYWSSDLLPVGFLESSSWNWEDLVQCLSTDQQPALLH